GHVGIACGQAVAVADLDHLAVSCLAADEGDAAGGGGMDRRADRTAKVEARGQCAAAGEGVAAITEARSDHAAVGGHELRDALEAALERIHPREACAEPGEARVERTVAAGRELLERTTLCGAGGAHHCPGVE